MDAFSLNRTIVVLLAIGSLATFDVLQRLRHRNFHLMFAVVFGTLASVGIIRIAHAFQVPGTVIDNYAAALGILLLILGWKALFGPWEPETKATILGSFLFWVGLSVLGGYDPDARKSHILAGIAALVPAFIWCTLFLKYHRERRSVVLLMFLAGMLSTVPILFYDTLVRRSVELHFFVMRVVPESFHATADAFVRGTLGVQHPLYAMLLSTGIAFVIVACIEEFSKYWVLRKSVGQAFQSIDDVMQMSVIVAIGFSFAENVVNPVYFQSFVREYLVQPPHPDLVGFISNILGRSVLTTMVHIVSTGVLGYFVGLSVFAHPILIAERTRKRIPIVHRIARILHVSDESVFRWEMITCGLFSAVVLHGCFNFLVTLPDILPGEPKSFGDLLGAVPGSWLFMIPLLVLPALLYVVGGFWLLTWLFLLKENMVNRGHVRTSEVFDV